MAGTLSSTLCVLYSKEELHKGSASDSTVEEGERCECFVLPLVRAAPFELLGPWCPSFLLLGFTIDRSWCATPPLSERREEEEEEEEEGGFVRFEFPLFWFCSHSPAGVFLKWNGGTMHSRPALHNLRMEEGASASHCTRVVPWTRWWWGGAQGCAHTLLHKYVFVETHTGVCVCMLVWVSVGIVLQSGFSCGVVLFIDFCRISVQLHLHESDP